MERAELELAFTTRARACPSRSLAGIFVFGGVQVALPYDANG